MFHELILTLNGYVGDVFQLTGNVFQIRTDLKFPLVHPSELVALNDILEIASLYKILNEFVEEQQTITLRYVEPEPGGSFTSGIYASSICNGLSEILNTYIEIVAELELKILNDPYITLNHIKVELEPFRTLFRVLTGLISNVKAQGKSSCSLVEIVKAEYDSNIPLHESLKIIIPWVQRTLFSQITNWVVFGNLTDPTSEFFIQLCKDENHFFSPSISTPASTKQKISLKRKDQKYYVNYSIVPSHLSVPLVERILFLGNSVAILENSEKTRAGLMEKQKVFFEKMKRLPINTFRTDDLSDTIDELSSCIGKDLHHLVVTETDLPKHLGIVKDFYLGGRGELFHDLLISLMQSANPDRSENEESDETEDMVAKERKKIVSSKIHLDIKGAFALAATRVQVQEDILARIQILAPTNIVVDEKNALEKCFGNISLKMESEWPLHILFTPESTEKYNEMFRFLLQIRLLQLQLLNIWTETKRIFRFIFLNGPCQLLSNMTYFVNNLQYYLQADVLETQFSILMAAVEKSESFEQIRVAHVTFQSNIWAQSFRTVPSVYGEIQKMLEVCKKYCEYMKEQINMFKVHGIPVCESAEDKTVKVLFKDFNRQIELTISRFKGLAGNSQVGPYLGQLLLRLDFNSYYSQEYTLVM